MLNEERNSRDAFVYDDKVSLIINPLHIIASFHQLQHRSERRD